MSQYNVHMCHVNTVVKNNREDKSTKILRNFSGFTSLLNEACLNTTYACVTLHMKNGFCHTGISHIMRKD